LKLCEFWSEFLCADITARNTTITADCVPYDVQCAAFRLHRGPKERFAGFRPPPATFHLPAPITDAVQLVAGGGRRDRARMRQQHDRLDMASSTAQDGTLSG